MRILASIGAALVALLFCAASAADLAPLTTADIERFLASTKDADAVFDKLKAEGYEPAADGEMMPKAGEPFEPFAKLSGKLKADRPGDYASLEGAVKPHGYSGVPQWATDGDRSIAAYLAVELEKQDPQALAMASQMTPEMLKMIPEAQRAQMQGALAMIEAVKAVPAADKEAMRPVAAKFESTMEELGKD